MSYWKGKKVFITGINGFIGGNLSKALIEQGAEVFGLIRNLNRETFLFFEGLANRVVLIEGDLTDAALMNRVISEEQINVVFHLAAQVEVGIGLENPWLTFETNVRGTYTLLEAIRRYPNRIEAAVMASSDKAYGSYGRDAMPYKEHYPLIPAYPYDTSKACADMIAQAYASDVYNLPIVITRFCNIYGPGQLNFSAIMPDAITSAQGHSHFVPRGDGSMIRDFIFVEDVAELYLTIAEGLAHDPKRISGHTFNAGTNTPISVGEVLEKIYRQVGNLPAYERILKQMRGKQTSGEISCQFMDFEKVNEYFGWAPKHTFDSGLTKTISWYERYNNKRFAKSEQRVPMQP